VFTSELRNRVWICQEGDRDLYVVRAWHSDDPPFEPWQGDPATACIYALRAGRLPDLWRAFGGSMPHTRREQEFELLELIGRGTLVVRSVSRAVLTLRAPLGEPLPIDIDIDIDEPEHVLSITSEDKFDVDLGDTVTITADGAPPGTYAWSIESGPGSLRGSTATPTARVHGDGPGTVVVLVEHTWAGDVKRARATIVVNQYVWQWDPPHVAPHDQFVNLPHAWEPACNGREVELVGHIEPRCAGKTVRFNVIPNPANEPDTVTASADATLDHAAAITDASGVARVKVTLPWYGGSRWKVGGRTDTMAPAPIEAGEITVWRKVFYQRTEMASPPAPSTLSLAAPADMIPALIAAFDPVFIKLAPGVKEHDTTPYQEHLTAAQRTALGDALRPTAVDARSPFKMNIITIDKADIVADQTWAGTTNAAVFVMPTWIAKWAYDPTVITAQYQKADGTWDNLIDVQVNPNPADATQVSIQAEVPGFAAPSTVNVSIHYRHQRGTAGGWGGTTGTLFMCIGRDRRANAATPTGAQLQQALTHEIGHALGLVPTTAAWLDPDPRDAPYSLRHCKYKDTAATPEPRCVMWFMLGGSGARLRFCKDDRPDDCSHFLYRSNYGSLSWI
jgi:hypothetical protein